MLNKFGIFKQHEQIVEDVSFLVNAPNMAFTGAVSCFLKHIMLVTFKDSEDPPWFFQCGEYLVFGICIWSCVWNLYLVVYLEHIVGCARKKRRCSRCLLCRHCRPSGQGQVRRRAKQRGGQVRSKAKGRKGMGGRRYWEELKYFGLHLLITSSPPESVETFLCVSLGSKTQGGRAAPALIDAPLVSWEIWPRNNQSRSQSRFH